MKSVDSGTRARLRVGVVHDGVLIEERTFDAARTITIGRGARCTLALFTDDAPVRQRLFERVGGRGFALCLDETTDGRIAQGGAVSELELLRSTGAVERRGRRARLALGERCRGRVAVGDYTVLFQLIPASRSRAPRPALPAALRGSLRVGFDSAVAYLWLAALLLHAAVIVYWQATDWPLAPRYDPDAAVAYAPLVKTEPVPRMIEREQPEPADEAAWEDVDEWEELKEHRPRSVDRRKNRVDAARRAVAQSAGQTLDRQQREQLLARIGAAVNERIGVIGSAGAAGEVFAPGAPGVDMEALISSLGYAGTGEPVGALRGPAGGKLGDEVATVTAVRVGGGNATVATRGPGVERRLGRVRRERASAKSSPGYLDVAAVTAIVKRAAGAIKGCYERELPRHPELSGRIAVRFTIAGSGRVVSTELTANELNDQVGRCVAGVFGRLRFPGPDGGQAIFEYPFFFMPVK